MDREIFNLIQPLCDNSKVYLYKVTTSSSGKSIQIRVVVDTEEGISLSQCKSLSQNISDLLYRKDLFQRDFSLEVSSPGVDKSLEKPFEYKRNIGRDLKVIFRDGEKTNSIIGKLTGINKNKITLQTDNEELGIDLNNIEQAKIKLKW